MTAFATLATGARWTAIAIAVAAILDPAVPLPSRARPAVRVTGAPGDTSTTVTRQLRDAGFRLDEAEGEVATVFVGNAPGTSHVAPGTWHLPVWALDTTPHSPHVRIVDATGPAVRLPGQAVEVRVTLDARGLAGKTSEVVLEDAGIAVASARHAWKADIADERWQASLQYLPPGAAGGRLRVNLVGIPGETSSDDNAAEVGMPPMRGPIRTLVVEARVTWPAMFVRRAVEGEPAFAVVAVQRVSKRIATRAGAPPAALTREALALFEVALVGAPDNLTATEIDALRWFVEQRGGVAVLIPDQQPCGPDQQPCGRYVELLGAPVFEPRAVETPVRLRLPALSLLEGSSVEGSLVEEGLLASELLIARRLPPGTRTLAATDSNEAVVFSARRGAGAVIFSGALDAWRYRARNENSFARFWRRAIAEEATTVPPVLEVSVDPSLVATGASTRVRARLRATELSASAESLDIDLVTARAVSPGAHVDVLVRLWPTAEPGVYEGEWRPSVPGDYNIAVTAGPRRGDAPVTVAATISHGSAADPEGLALVARTSGGRVFPADQSAALVEGMTQAFPARTSLRTMHPMRSSWWVVPFAGLLCAEWAVRRRQGNP